VAQPVAVEQLKIVLVSDLKKVDFDFA